MDCYFAGWRLRETVQRSIEPVRIALVSLGHGVTCAAAACSRAQGLVTRCSEQFESHLAAARRSSPVNSMPVASRSDSGWSARIAGSSGKPL
jgi:hypothetical protein